MGRVEVVQADLLDPKTLEDVFDGVDVAYYLVHSMYSGTDFDRQDRLAAENFCRFAGSVSHVIYLGGLLPRRRGASQRSVSKHLLSRAEIGRILSRHLPVTELRAGPIIGSGSASFEMLRYITERLPVIVAPSWVGNEVQPIAIRDVMSYLQLALERGPSGVVEIGGETLTYKEMMLAYAELRGLRRRVIPMPRFFPFWASSLWVGLSTPIPRALAAPLIEGMAQPLTAGGSRARRFFGQVEPIPYRRALEMALERIEERAVETRWSDARTDSPARDYQDSEGLIRDVRTIHVNAPPEGVFRVLSGIGGDRGWPTWNWAYRLGGMFDYAIGGPGLRRGRRDPRELLTGEAVDFWRVETITSPHLLRLCCEIKFPGRAWLQWELIPERGGTQLTQTVTIAPRGVSGALYWYSLYPFHRWFFRRTIRAIGMDATAAEGLESARSGKIAPPVASKGVFGDVLAFFLPRSPTTTLIEFPTQADRENYSYRIMQRLAIDVSQYSVLNLHQIGIEAPVQSVFEELEQWSGHSSCWPNYVAAVERTDDRIEEIKIRLLGLSRIPFGRRTRVGWRVPPLFVMKALRIQRSPGDLETDNARYMLYSCSGGYPIGIFVIYVRSSIAEQGEVEMTQVFFGVGFDFYGKEGLSRIRALTGAWETVHNLVTTNVLNRFKQLCEWRFQRWQDGDQFPSTPHHDGNAAEELD